MKITKNILNDHSKGSKKIISILKKIYRQILTKQNIDLLKNEIVQLIEDFNKKNRVNKINISEKTSLVISLSLIHI
mgnify:CR=1 FL=1